jgi:hypothetical protein
VILLLRRPAFKKVSSPDILLVNRPVHDLFVFIVVFITFVELSNSKVLQHIIISNPLIYDLDSVTCLQNLPLNTMHSVSRILTLFLLPTTLFASPKYSARHYNHTRTYIPFPNTTTPCDFLAYRTDTGTGTSLYSTATGATYKMV